MNIDMFPGQGAQHPGMGEELFSLYPEEVRIASEVLGYDVVDICLHDKEQKLNLTQYTQPLLYLVSALGFLEKKQKPDAVMGHSLGLYPALFAAEVLDFTQGLSIVKERARLMAQAQNGSMLAVIGTDCDKIDDFIVNHGFTDVDVANDNSYTQRVLSGRKERLEELAPLLQNQSFRVIPLAVSGAFHSRYMKKAAASFFNFLIPFQFAEAKIPVISTTHGNIILKSHWLEELTYQLIHPVRWRQTITQLARNNPQITFNEVGPGRILSQLTQQILAHKDFK